MSDPFYRSPAWRRLRAEALARDNHRCVLPGCGRKAHAVDHILQRSRGGADALPNLRSLCEQHHNQRRQGGEPRVLGCDASGWPLDPRHPWRG